MNNIAKIYDDLTNTRVPDETLSNSLRNSPDKKSGEKKTIEKNSYHFTEFRTSLNTTSDKQKK